MDYLQLSEDLFSSLRSLFLFKSDLIKTFIFCLHCIFVSGHVLVILIKFRKHGILASSRAHTKQFSRLILVDQLNRYVWHKFLNDFCRPTKIGQYQTVLILHRHLTQLHLRRVCPATWVGYLRSKFCVILPN